MSSPKLGAGTTDRLDATLQTATKPTLDVAAIQAQIISNALALETMAYAQANLRYPVKEHEGSSPIIMTTNEAGQVRAAVVHAGTIDGDQMMTNLFQGSLADSDGEALLSLYEESKNRTTKMKKSVEDNGRWWRG